MKLFIALIALVTFSRIGLASANESVELDVTAQYDGADGGFYPIKKTLRAELVDEKRGPGQPANTQFATIRGEFTPPTKAAGDFRYELLLMVFRHSDDSGRWPGRVDVNFTQRLRTSKLRKTLITATVDLRDISALSAIVEGSPIVVSKTGKCHVTLFVTDLRIMP